MAKTGLTAKQARFVEEYLVDLNATQATIRAGYSAKTAKEMGHKLVHKSSLAAAIAKGQEVRSERTEIDQDWVLGNIKTVVERCIAVGEDFDATAVLRGSELAGRHLGMWKDKIEHSGSIGLESVLEAIDGQTRGIPDDRTTRH